MWTFNSLESSLLQRCKAACKKVETCWSCWRAGAHLLMGVQTSACLHSCSPAAQFQLLIAFQTPSNCQSPLHHFRKCTHTFFLHSTKYNQAQKATNENGCAKKAIHRVSLWRRCVLSLYNFQSYSQICTVSLTFKTTDLQLF